MPGALFHHVRPQSQSELDSTHVGACRGLYSTPSLLAKAKSLQSHMSTHRPGRREHALSSHDQQHILQRLRDGLRQHLAAVGLALVQHLRQKMLDGSTSSVDRLSLLCWSFKPLPSNLVQQGAHVQVQMNHLKRCLLTDGSPEMGKREATPAGLRPTALKAGLYGSLIRYEWSMPILNA